VLHVIKPKCALCTGAPEHMLSSNCYHLTIILWHICCVYVCVCMPWNERYDDENSLQTLWHGTARKFQVQWKILKWEYI